MLSRFVMQYNFCIQPGKKEKKKKGLLSNQMVIVGGTVDRESNKNALE